MIFDSKLERCSNSKIYLHTSQGLQQVGCKILQRYPSPRHYGSALNSKSTLGAAAASAENRTEREVDNLVLVNSGGFLLCD